MRRQRRPAPNPLPALVWLFATWSLALGACGGGPRAASAEQHLALRAGLLRAPVIELECSHPAFDGLARESADRLSRAAEAPAGDVRLAAPESWGRVDVRPADGAARPDAARGVLAEVASPLAAPLREALGIECLADGGFRFRGTDYTAAADGVRGVLPDPLRPGVPVGFLLVNEADVFADATELLVLGWRPFVEVLRSAELERRFAVFGAAPHELQVEFDRSDLFDRPRARFLTHREGDVNFLVRKDPALLDLLPSVPRLEEGMRAARSAVSAFFESAGLQSIPVDELPRAVVHGFPGEAYVDGNTPLFARSDSATARLFVLLQGDRPAHAAAVETAKLLLEERLGPCRTPWFGRGLALALGLPEPELEARVAAVLRATLALSAEEITDSRGPWRSSLVRAPEEALLAELWLEREGAAAALDLWRGEARVESDAALEERLHAAHLAILEAAGEPEPAPGAEGPLRGFGMWLGGLDDPLRRAERVQLLEGLPFDEQVALGANAVLLSYPVTLGQRSESRLTGGDGRTPVSCPSLEELQLLLHQAERRGLDVVLWPRLLLGEQTSLTARAKWTTADELGGLFLDLREHLVHAALLARSESVEWLVLGGSLGLSSVTAEPEQPLGPAEEALRLRKLEEWGETIARVRAAAGPVALTLAPGGWSDALQADFADGLDAFGLSPFPGWTTADERERPPTAEEVERGFASALGRGREEADRRGLPLLLLEVGHARTAGASRRSARRAGPTDPNAQGQYLRGVLAALARRRAPVPEGLFLWRAGAPAAPPDPRGFLIDLSRDTELLRQLMRIGR